jgi:hypothetical protein
MPPAPRAEPSLAGANESGTMYLRVVENWFDELNALAPLPD